MKFTTVIAALPLAFAAPTTPNVDSRAALVSGESTYYDSGVGGAACDGVTYNGKTQHVAAISAAVFDAHKATICGKTVTIDGPAGSVDVKIVDRCAGCEANHIDLSESAFLKAIGPLGVGKAAMKYTNFL